MMPLGCSAEEVGCVTHRAAGATTEIQEAGLSRFFQNKITIQCLQVKRFRQVNRNKRPRCRKNDSDTKPTFCYLYADKNVNFETSEVCSSFSECHSDT